MIDVKPRNRADECTNLKIRVSRENVFALFYVNMKHRMITRLLTNIALEGSRHSLRKCPRKSL